MPFGFPSGDRLMDDIAKLAEQYRKKGNDLLRAIIDDLSQHAHRHVVHRFEYGLQRGSMRSLDHFVETNQQFDKVAKSFLAYKLIIDESNHIDNVFKNTRYYEDGSVGRIPNAIRHIFTQMHLSEDFLTEFGKHNFITFNYERTLEHYLHNMFEYGMCMGYDDIEKMQGTLKSKILHVYGQLGEYDRGEMEQMIEVEEPYVLLPYMREAVEGVNFIDRASDRVAIIKEMASLLASTEQVIVLGFGHERTNTVLIRNALQEAIAGKTAPRAGEGQLTYETLSDDKKQEVKIVMHQIVINNWFTSAYAKTQLEVKEFRKIIPFNTRNIAPLDQTDLDFLRHKIRIQ